MRLPPRVHRLSIVPPPADVLVAIGIHSNRGHVGILHRREAGGEFHVLHMCGHEKLKNESLRPASWTFWVSLQLITDEAEQIAASCRLFDTVTAIPYAFSSPRGFFNEKMKVNERSGAIGLTCATLVLAVFDVLLIDLVQLDSWPIRSDDSSRREDIVLQISAPEPHRTAVLSESSVPQYRPLEVAGAGARKRYPVHFIKALRYSRRIQESWVD